MSDITDQQVLDMLRAANAELEKWLAWSGGRYPDDSPGDVIAAYADGTITLDDAIVTWNPLRALDFYAKRVESIDSDLAGAYRRGVEDTERRLAS